MTPAHQCLALVHLCDSLVQSIPEFINGLFKVSLLGCCFPQSVLVDDHLEGCDLGSDGSLLTFKVSNAGGKFLLLVMGPLLVIPQRIPRFLICSCSTPGGIFEPDQDLLPALIEPLAPECNGWAIPMSGIDPLFEDAFLFAQTRKPRRVYPLSSQQCVTISPEPTDRRLALGNSLEGLLLHGADSSLKILRVLAKRFIQDNLCTHFGCLEAIVCSLQLSPHLSEP